MQNNAVSAYFLVIYVYYFILFFHTDLQKTAAVEVRRAQRPATRGAAPWLIELSIGSHSLRKQAVRTSLVVVL